jgi:hypothetical protein
MTKKILIALIFLIIFYTLHFTQSYAEEKNWSGAGDGVSWSDENNWYPKPAPASSDDVLIDSEDASVACSQTFKAKSITVAGRQGSTLTSENFIVGTISPASGSDVAIQNRKDGKIILKGEGAVTVQGQYKDSEEPLVAEPSFMFWMK